MSNPIEERPGMSTGAVPDTDSEAISRSVDSLPPEKMFELMKQMKEVMRSNPNEAKHMLLTNTQLAYALLQAQVVMRIVDPQVALAMLQREAPLQSSNFTQPPPVIPQQFAQPAVPQMRGPPPSMNMPPPGGFRQPAMPPPKQKPQMPEENDQLLRRVMELSPEQIVMLPPSDREKVIELRRQLQMRQ